MKVQQCGLPTKGRAQAASQHQVCMNGEKLTFSRYKICAMACSQCVCVYIYIYIFFLNKKLDDGGGTNKSLLQETLQISPSQLQNNLPDDVFLI